MLGPALTLAAIFLAACAVIAGIRVDRHLRSGQSRSAVRAGLSFAVCAIAFVVAMRMRP